MVGRDGQQGDDRLCGVTVAASRRSQSIADLDAVPAWPTLKADHPDGPPVLQAGDAVGAERPLFSARAVARRKPRTTSTGTSKGKSSAQISSGPEFRETMRSPSATSMAWSCSREVLRSVMAPVKQPLSPSATEFHRPSDGTINQCCSPVPIYRYWAGPCGPPATARPDRATDRALLNPPTSLDNAIPNERPDYP